MTIARTMLIGGLVAAGALLGIVAPGILRMLVAIAWGIVVFVAVQTVLAGVLAFVGPAALFPPGKSWTRAPTRVKSRPPPSDPRRPRLIARPFPPDAGSHRIGGASGADRRGLPDGSGHRVRAPVSAARSGSSHQHSGCGRRRGLRRARRPSRGPSTAAHVTAYVVSGVGFLGAGAIMKDGTSVSGLTTAATLWGTAAAGACAGAGMITEAMVAAVGVIGANTTLRATARRYRRDASPERAGSGEQGSA